MNNIVKSKWLWIAIVAIISLLTIPFFGERIPSTAQGIKIDTWETGEDGQPKTEHVSGWIWYNPVRYSIIEYPAEYQQVVGEYTFLTKEKLPVQVVVSAFIRPQRRSAGNIYKKFRVKPKQLYSTLVDDLLNDATKKAGEATPTDELGSFTKLQTALEEELSKSLPQQNLEFTKVIIKDIDLPDEIESAVRAKTKAAEEIANQKQQTILQAETNKRELMKAEGQTAVMEEKARAEAFKIKQESQELTKLQIRKMWIEKWDGKLPSTMTSDDLQMLMNFD